MLICSLLYIVQQKSTKWNRNKFKTGSFKPPDFLSFGFLLCITPSAVDPNLSAYLPLMHPSGGFKESVCNPKKGNRK